MTADRRIALAVRRGELIARCAMQREALASHSRPVAEVAGAADRAMEGLRWLRQHPGAVAAGALALVVVSPGRAWRWAKRGFVAWRGWQAVQRRLFGAL